MFRVSISFNRECIENPGRAAEEQIANNATAFTAGMTVAIAVGSRGVANLSEIVRGVVKGLKALGARPFIFPAMGSHGGATAKGQTALLSCFGITKRSMGCPVRSSMEVVELKSGGLGHRLFMDRNAHEADGILLVNRIKAHTDFHGAHESGLAKMAVIGVGKERQASEMHRFGVHGLRDLMPETADRLFATGKFIGGIALVENAYEQTAVVEFIPAGKIMEREPQLLALAKKRMPRLPVDDIDVLIVDRLGKEISGSGMDTNIIGRIRIPGEPEPKRPRIKSIIVDGLTKESHGNATGMGLADVTTRKFFNSIDFKVTNKNIITSAFLERGKVPIVAENARESLEFATRSCGPAPAGGRRIMRIRDTLHLETVYVSLPIADEIRKKSNITVEDEPVELFDRRGNLRRF